MSKQIRIAIGTVAACLAATSSIAQLFPSNPPKALTNSGPTVTTVPSADFSKQLNEKAAQSKDTLNQQYNQQLSQVPQPKLPKNAVVTPAAPSPSNTSTKSSSPIPAPSTGSNDTTDTSETTSAPTESRAAPTPPPPPQPPTTTTTSGAPSTNTGQQPYTGFQGSQPGAQPQPSNQPKSGGWNIKY